MDLTTTAYGTWSGGRFMHFGEQLDEDRYVKLVRLNYEKGIRTFVTADVYGAGRADSLLGEALRGIDRSTYSLVGIIGHDFYGGLRAGAKGYILKDQDSADIVPLLQGIAAGRPPLSPTIARKILASFRPAVTKTRTSVDSLTGRETEVLTFISAAFHQY